MCVCVRACVRLFVCVGMYIHIYILTDILVHTFIYHVEFDGSTRLSGSRLFRHAECWEVNNNVNTSRHQDWIRQVSRVLLLKKWF